MITITLKQLEKMGAYIDGIEWFKERKVYTLKKLLGE